jgi:hypothetical protein
VESLVLPFLTDEDTLDEALNRMMLTDSRAIVVEHFAPEQYSLYMNREVVSAWHSDVATCVDLQKFKGEVIPQLQPLTAAKAANSLKDLIEHQLDEIGARLGLPFPPRSGPNSTTVVVTRNEYIRDEVRLAGKVCGCGGPSRHMEDSPPAADGAACDLCGHMYKCY